MVIAVPIVLPPPGNTLNNPFGKPASSKNEAKINPPVTIDVDAGFKTTALPTANAGPKVRAVNCPGKFQGEINPITPNGFLTAIDSLPSISLGKILPSTNNGKCTALSKTLATNSASK